MNSAFEIQTAKVPGQQETPTGEFPLALVCVGESASLADCHSWLRERRGELIERAHRHGAVLFRGFPVHNAEDFDRFISAFELANFPYEQSLSNAVRVNYTPRVFSANEAPSEVTIFLHHEMAQTPIYPSKLFFYCEVAAETGGATPLCRSDVLYRWIQDRYPEFATRCEERGLRYSNVMPSSNDPLSGMGRSWQSTLRAETQGDAENRLRELGYTWEWLPDGCLRATTPRLPAVRTLEDGRKVFFNQLIAAFRGWKDTRNDPSKAITFGDGRPLDREIVMAVAEEADRISFEMAWQHGDVVLLDNVVAMHGRRTFTGKRRVLASLIEAQRNA